MAYKNGLDKQIIYDAYGRPTTTRSTVTNGPSFAAQVGYDPNGRVTSQIYPTGLTVNYVYTTKGFLSQVTLGTAATVTPLPAPGGTAGASTTLAIGSPLWTAGSYNAWGKSEQQTYGNGIVSQASFDGLTGRVGTSTAGLNGGTGAMNYIYAWDSLNHLTGRTDENGDGTTGAVTDNYFYDSLGRLQSYSVSSNSMPSLQQRSVTLEYNALGMTLYKSDVGVYTYPTQGGVQPHALQNIAGEINSNYSYDFNGNLTASTSGSYRAISYTSFNLPDSNTGVQGIAGTPQYTWQYDENHQRIKETRVDRSGTRVVWMLHPDNAGGLGFESETGANGIISNRHLERSGLAVPVQCCCRESAVQLLNMCSKNASTLLYKCQRNASTVRPCCCIFAVPGCWPVSRRRWPQ